MAEYNQECHYSTFCSYVPDNVVKPKPQDWGTCLCMPCLNPELKLEALKKFDSLSNDLDVQMLVNNENEMELLKKRLTEADEEKISFLYWKKENTETSDDLDSTKGTGYMSRKKIATVKTTKFFDLFVADINKLRDHNA